MGGHSSHSSPFPSGVNSSSTPLAPVSSTVSSTKQRAAVGLLPAASFKAVSFRIAMLMASRFSCATNPLDFNEHFTFPS